MKYRKLLLLLTAAVLSAKASASNIGTDVRFGVLPNGFTYYICQNDNPAGTADYFFAQRVGSVNESEDQRGLAHFLEHMCFNGTRNFPGNSLITYLESIGVKFGAHLNAYTSTDETVYNICKAPSTRQSTVDSCLMIIRDWSCDLTLADEDIDAERGVIVNEWRQRNSASNRMLERVFPRLYKGSPYGERLPIGLMSIVENFKPETLRRFYDKWYIPANQAVIVVGDVDVDATEKTIREMFGSLPAARSAESEIVALSAVPVDKELTCVVASDPEQGAEMLQVYFRLPEVPEDLDEEIRRKVVGDMAAGMLAERFEAMEAEPTCPHTSLGIGEVKYFMSRGEQALTMRGGVKAGCESEALAAWYGELLRAVQHGFSDEELAAGRSEALKALEEKARRESSPNNTMLARGIVRHFIDGGYEISRDDYRLKVEQAIAAVTADDVRDYLRMATANGPVGTVIYLTRPRTEISDTDVEKQLTVVFNQARSKTYEPVSRRERSEVLMTELPTSGSIVGVDKDGKYGTTVYTLSNGIKVHTLRTDYKPDQIYIRTYSPGGLSQVYNDSDVATLRVINELMAAMPVGSLSATDARRILDKAGIKISVSVGNMEEGMESAANRAGLEPALQAMYLRATHFDPDSAAFANFIDAQRSSINNRRLNPTQIMGDSIHYTIYNHHPLAGRQTLDDIAHIDMQKALEVYSDRFADMSDFTFMVVGDFDTDTLETYLARYVASLPAGDRVEKAREFGYKYTPYSFESRFARPMENPQPIVYSFFNGDTEYTLSNILNATVFGQILRMRLLADLREDKGWTYSIKTHCAVNPGVSAESGPQVMMPTYIKVTPGKENQTLEAVYATIDSLASGASITDEEVSGIKNFLMKNHEEAIRDNAYWLKIIKANLTQGVDLESGYAEAVEAITPASVADFARCYLLPAHRAALVMSAE